MQFSPDPDVDPDLTDENICSHRGPHLWHNFTLTNEARDMKLSPTCSYKDADSAV